MLTNRNEFFDTFKLWLLKVKACKSKLDCLWKDGGGEFISAVFQTFCQEWEIKIGYIAFSIHEKNSIMEQCWRTLAQMKDFLLIYNKLSKQFWAEAMDTANYL